MVSPNDTIALPVRLSVPFPLDIVLACHPEGVHHDHGRDTLVFSCLLDQKVTTDRLDAHLQLAGMEQIDVQTGIRLFGVLTGSLSGRKRSGDDTAWHTAEERILYRRATELE